MSFMKSLIKPIAQIGASFIPGIGPIASSLIGGIGGAAADAYGSSGKQGQQRSSSTTTSNQTETGRSTSSQESGGSYQNTQQAIEDPLMSMFRQSVIGGLSDATSRAREPIYGDREKASFLNDLNDLAGGATTALRSQLAGRGALDSGQLEQGAGQIQNQRLSEAVKYFSQIPALNRQYSDQNEQNLLGLSANLAGRAPISTIQSGTSQQSTTGQQDFTSNRTGTSQTDGLQEMFGPSFGKGLLSNLGGLGGALFGNALAGGFGGQATGNPTGLSLFNPQRTRTYMDMLNPYGRR